MPGWSSGSSRTSSPPHSSACLVGGRQGRRGIVQVGSMQLAFTEVYLLGGGPSGMGLSHAHALIELNHEAPFPLPINPAPPLTAPPSRSPPSSRASWVRNSRWAGSSPGSWAPGRTPGSGSPAGGVGGKGVVTSQCSNCWVGNSWPRQLGPWQNSRIRVTCEG